VQQLGSTIDAACGLVTFQLTLPSSPLPPSPRPPFPHPHFPPGPPLHVEVGDMLVVVLRNNLDFPINILPGGVQADGGPPTLNPGDTYTAR
jgi:hypothetical protein